MKFRSKEKPSKILQAVTHTSWICQNPREVSVLWAVAERGAESTEFQSWLWDNLEFSKKKKVGEGTGSQLGEQRQAEGAVGERGAAPCLPWTPWLLPRLTFAQRPSVYNHPGAQGLWEVRAGVEKDMSSQVLFGHFSTCCCLLGDLKGHSPAVQ